MPKKELLLKVQLVMQEGKKKKLFQKDHGNEMTRWSRFVPFSKNVLD